MNDIPDVDIDVADYDAAVALFKDRAVLASLYDGSTMVRHNNGIYLQRIPVNPLNGLAAFPYKIAEELGYYKIDLLPVNVYKNFDSMDELRNTLKQPINWDWFKDVNFVRELFHLGGIVNTEMTVAQIVAYYEPKSILDLACMVAIKLPAKKHLIKESWGVVREQIWLPEPPERGRQFKKSHAVAYAMVVALDARVKKNNEQQRIQSS